MKKQAFTLSEVLLVLGIIGVIAAVTIPTVTSSNQNKKYTALTRKAQTTLQGAIDNKLAYTLGRPAGNTLFAWLTAGEENGHDTIKFIKKNGEIITTPDGMVFYADGAHVTDGRLKYQGNVYVDLNGAGGPTETTVDNGTILKNAANSAVNFDVVSFEITKDGDVKVTNAKARKYLEM